MTSVISVTHYIQYQVFKFILTPIRVVVRGGIRTQTQINTPHGFKQKGFKQWKTKYTKQRYN